MPDQLDLRVPGRDGETTARPARKPTVLLVLVLLLAAANLGVTLWRSGTGATGPAPHELDAEARKDLALKLEKQGLNQAAAEAWRDYLAVAGGSAERVAKLWYRIGTLHQEARQYEQALDSYYRSERFADVDVLAGEIGRRTQECLEALGKFAALRYELAERVGLDEDAAAAGDTVVAEIGPRTITQAELDGLIEARIERQLSQFASFLPQEERRQQKEQLLQQFSTTTQRLQFLNEVILQEMLSRRARELQLTEDPEVRALLEDQERAVLASRVIEQAYSDRINITPGDLQTYYQAHKGSYTNAGEDVQPFDEVRTEIYQSLRAQKERDVQARLLEELREQYDVVVHYSAFGGREQ
jgi:hypothetical protein